MTDIDPFDVLGALGVQGCTSATRVHGGWDTTIWRVTCGGQSFALRLHRPENIAWVEQEIRTMTAAATAGVSAPALCARGVWNGRAALLLEWCAGRTMMQEIRRKPWSTRSFGEKLGMRQAELHQVAYAPPETGHHDWITRFGPVDDELRERLIDVAGPDNRLVHFDLHPLNVMVAGGEVGCILDWTNAASGDPRADVARTWSILRLLPLSPNRPEPVTEVARKLLAAGWLRAYTASGGPLLDMPLFKAWAGAAMVTDMQRNVDRPEIWIEQRHVDALQARVDELRLHAGLSPARQ